MRRLQQDARAVARVDLRAGRAAVLEVVEHVERSLDRPVARVAGQAGNRADAAVVVLEVGVVEARGLMSLKSVHIGVTCGRSLDGRYGGESGILAAVKAERLPRGEHFSVGPPARLPVPVSVPAERLRR